MPDAPRHVVDEAGPRTGRSTGRFGPMFWIQLLLGLAIAGYGVWMLSERAWKSPTGFLILCIGVMVMPFWAARLLGGVAIIGLAGWLAAHAAGAFDYLMAALYAFVGFSSAAEGVRGARGVRQSGAGDRSSP